MNSDIFYGLVFLFVGVVSLLIHNKYQSEDDPIGNKWRAYSVIFSGFVGGFYLLIKGIISWW